MSAVIDTHHHDHAHGPAKGLMRWVLTTNHKDIGSMYLWFSFAMFLLGGSMAMVIRAELFQPGLQLVQPEFFNQMTTTHGLIMVFGAVMPAFVGLANWMIPLMIGAPDMALPRMNNFSFWLLPMAFGLLVSTLFMEEVARTSAGPSMHRCRRPMRRPASPSSSSPFTWQASARSWARSTSSPPSSTCAHPA